LVSIPAIGRNAGVIWLETSVKKDFGSVFALLGGKVQLCYTLWRLCVQISNN